MSEQIKMTRGQLQDLLSRFAVENPKYREALIKDPKTPVLIGGDKNARYEAVLQVMDELRSKGVERVGLQVKPKP